ncbi:MAG: O-antigen ligase [Planctomycetota bacterium]|jgi:O-antigen ligase
MNFFLKNSQLLANKSLILFSFSIATFPIVSSIVLIVFSAFNVFYGYIKRKEIKRVNFSGYIAIWGLLVMYLVALTYSPNLSYSAKYLSRSVALVLIPFVFWCRGGMDTKLYSEVTKYFILGVLTSCVLSLSISLIAFFQTGDINHFTYYELAETIDLHPTYFSLFILTALVFLSKQRNISNLFKFIISLTCLATLMLLQSRIALFGLTGLIIYSYLNTSTKFFKKLILFGSIIIVLIGINSTDLSSRIIEVVDFEPSLEAVGTFDENGINQRFWLWSAAFGQIKERPLLGYGLGAQRNLFKWQVQKGFLQQEFNYELFLAGKNLSDKNLHNQYLQLWYEGGVLGLLLFLMALISMFYKHNKNKSFGKLSVLLIFSIFLITENMMARQMGIFFYAFIFSFFLSESKESTV